MSVLVTGGTGYLGSAIVTALREAGHEPIVFARRAHPDGIRSRETFATHAPSRARLRRPTRSVIPPRSSACGGAIPPSSTTSTSAACSRCSTQHAPCRRRAFSTPRRSWRFRQPTPAPGDGQRLPAHEGARARSGATRGSRWTAGRRALSRRRVRTRTCDRGQSRRAAHRDHLERRLPGVIGGERRWSFAYVDDVARAHVVALTRGDPRRDYVVGGENAPQRAIFDFLARVRGLPLPRRIPYSVATAAGVRRRSARRDLHREPLLTRGVVEIFRHDWSMDSTRHAPSSAFTITPLDSGLERTLASLS